MITMLTQVDLIGLLGIWVTQTIRDVIIIRPIISQINQIGSSLAALRVTALLLVASRMCIPVYYVFMVLIGCVGQHL